MVSCYGLYAEVWNIDHDVVLDLSWEHPFTIHLEGTDSSLGHFVVKVPEQNGLWEGRRGFQDFDRHASGSILLTISEPIVEPALEFRRKSVSMLVLFGIARAIFVTGMLISRAKSSRCFSRSVFHDL